MFSMVALQALWASSIPMSKIILQFTSPIFLTAARMLIAGALLLFYEQFFTKQKLRFESRHWHFYVQIIFFGIYLKYILRYWSLNQLSTTKMSFMLNLTPFFVAFFAYLTFNEKLTLKKWIGLILGFASLIPILTISSSMGDLSSQLLLFSWAEIGVFAEIAAHSYSMIVMRKMVRDSDYSASMTNGIRMFGGGILALITTYFFETFVPITQLGTFLGWLGAIIIISNIVCHNLYIYLLKKYSATFLSFTDFLSPLFVAFYGWLFLHETITWHYSVSTALVLIGLSLFYYDELRAENKATFIPARVQQWWHRFTIKQPEKTL